MRTIEVKERAATGGGHSQVKYTLTDLIRRLTKILFMETLAPINLVNEALALGYYDAGMSGAWKWAPFKIQENEYLEARAHLEQQGLVKNLCSTELKDFDAWHDWIFVNIIGIPSETYLPLIAQFRDICREIESIEFRGVASKDNALDEIHASLYEKIRDLENSYLLKYRRLRNGLPRVSRT